MANSSWNAGNNAGQQIKPMPNLNNKTPYQKSQIQLGYTAGKKK